MIAQVRGPAVTVRMTPCSPLTADSSGPRFRPSVEGGQGPASAGGRRDDGDCSDADVTDCGDGVAGGGLVVWIVVHALIVVTQASMAMSRRGDVLSTVITASAEVHRIDIASVQGVASHPLLPQMAWRHTVFTVMPQSVRSSRCGSLSAAAYVSPCGASVRTILGNSVGSHSSRNSGSSR